jgi:signal transduction histidine kinase
VKQDSFQNMIDRIGALGGAMQVESAPGRGTRIAGSVPVRTDDTSALNGFARSR